ncbi:MAG TPA: hypothetical protein VGE39_09775 [Prosthecobacter sp.]
MTVTLPTALETFVRQKIDSGLYHDADEVVVESLSLMQQQDVWKAAASAKIDEGLRHLDEGNSLTDEQSRAEMAAFKKRWQAGHE